MVKIQRLFAKTNLKIQFADAKRLKQNIAETMDYTIY